MASLQTSTKILLKIIEFDRGASLPYRYLETSPQLFPQQLHSRHPLSPPVPTHDCRASPFTQNERHSSPNRTNPYPVVIGNSDREKDLRAKKKKKKTSRSISVHPNNKSDPFIPGELHALFINSERVEHFKNNRQTNQPHHPSTRNKYEFEN